MNVPAQLFYVPEFGCIPSRVFFTRASAVEAALDEEIDGKTPIVICYSFKNAMALNKTNKEVKDGAQR